MKKTALQNFFTAFLLVLSLVISCVYTISIDVHEVEAATKWKKITKNKLNGRWFSGKYEYDISYSQQYYVMFNPEGDEVCVIGYRNYDLGTYKISKNKKKVVAIFDECYWDEPGKGYVRIKKGEKYKVTYRLKNRKKLYVQYGSGADHTNAESGYWLYEEYYGQY